LSQLEPWEAESRRVKEEMEVMRREAAKAQYRADRPDDFIYSDNIPSDV
jgi:hypothetical protein